MIPVFIDVARSDGGAILEISRDLSDLFFCGPLAAVYRTLERGPARFLNRRAVLLAFGHTEKQFKNCTQTRCRETCGRVKWPPRQAVPLPATAQVLHDETQ
jgi:hypothetical protein